MTEFLVFSSCHQSGTKLLRRRRCHSRGCAMERCLSPFPSLLHPRDQISEAGPCSLCLTTSGAIHKGVPFMCFKRWSVLVLSRLLSNLVAAPKSASFTPIEPTRTFFAFRSQCTIWWL
ncbi:hypothetical protein O6H91_11G040200 [Diphasiastrum complanatum]|uniref:Uncharacterized protein n=1 Tax=Diphasiastrum complanatum TaxID=34168 RepID=A0ACC2C9F7_DIPCM|nr:hypothetical protein O6H91_11G040200 [Diphasiastrum complanatum]